MDYGCYLMEWRSGEGIVSEDDTLELVLLHMYYGDDDNLKAYGGSFSKYHIGIALSTNVAQTEALSGY